MAERAEKHGEKKQDTRRDRGPGAHSGRESRARHRIVPGTASAAEGYSDSSTAEGDPLEGLRADEREPEQHRSSGRGRGRKRST